MIRVCVESPFRGDVPHNVRYADACLLDSLARGEAPFLGHLLYPRVLNDDHDAHRKWGIEAHLAWLHAAERVAVYVDLDVTSGMIRAITRAEQLGIPHEYRRIGVDWETRHASYARPTPRFF